jgi:MFS family permease
LVSVGFGAVAPALKEIQAAFGEGVQYGALLVSGFGLGRLLAGVPAGLFVDRVGPKRVVIGGAGLFVLGSLIGWVAPAAWVLVVGRVLQGSGCAVLPAGVLGRMMADGDPSQAGGRMALYQLAISGGTAVAPVVAGPLVVASGWRSTFGFSCLAGLIAVSLALTLRPSASGRTRAAPVSVPSGLAAWLTVLLVLVPNGIGAFDRFAVNQLALPLLAAGPAGLDPAATGVLVGGVTVVSLLAIGPSGWLTDRLGTARTVLGSAVLTLFAVLLMPRAPGLVGLSGASLAYALGVGVLGVAGAAYVFALPGRSIGTLVTLYRLSTDAIQVVGPFLVGLALDRWGFEPVFGGMAALGSAPLLAVALRRPANRRTRA